MLNLGQKPLLPAVVIGMCLASFATGAIGAEGDDTTVAPLQYLPAMHIFRRHAVEPEQMLEFYGDVLGFERMPNIGQTARVKTGATEFKLQRRGADQQYLPGGAQAATGFRLVGLYFADEAALVARFKEHGRAAPEFRSVSGSTTRVAFTTDPDGQQIGRAHV